MLEDKVISQRRYLSNTQFVYEGHKNRLIRSFFGSAKITELRNVAVFNMGGKRVVRAPGIQVQK